ncbi:MAG: AAA family ATPase [Candidatus Saccharibacteria bacterium]
MSKLIILRGNSGSGKSTVARELVKDTTRKTAIIAGDYYREHMLFPKGQYGEALGDLMALNVKYCLDHDFDVIWDSIFFAHERNRNYLAQILAKYHPQDNFIFNFDVSFEETARRHQTRELRHAFSAEQMREWYQPVESLGYDFEFTIPETNSVEQSVTFIRKTVNLKTPSTS